MLNDTKALAKGFWTTFKHIVRPPITVRYPDEKRTTAAKFRGRHRLYRDEDGLERCIGCELCAAACPSQAILVRAEENDPSRPVSPGERFASVYEINMIRCIFCGFCEEACPVDAIKLGPEYELSDFKRPDFVYTKEMLLDPEKNAPPTQFHADVERSTDERGVHTALGTVYRSHHPIGAPDPRPPVPTEAQAGDNEDPA
ncbi:MAG: NADH-quinone oxidoreductase subunit NuoI [Chloroflexi bacterium]|nr:NADH-quinone oxidoreductase subunit NuoI [Chloroflexota bacterium]